MARLASPLRVMLLLGLLHIHHRVKGPPFDYATLAAGAALSWFGVPGPGEPLMIAAGVLAGQGKLDLASVIVVGFLGAIAGAIGGWLLGLGAGRRLLTVRGPLLRFRKRMLAQGDRIFASHPVLGILLAPAPLAGIHRVGPVTFVATTFASAAVWAAGIGVGAYFAGPPIVEAVNDLGTATLIGLIVLVVGSVLGEVLRRRRRRSRDRTALEGGAQR